MKQYWMDIFGRVCLVLALGLVVPGISQTTPDPAQASPSANPAEGTAATAVTESSAPTASPAQQEKSKTQEIIDKLKNVEGKQGWSLSVGKILLAIGTLIIAILVIRYVSGILERIAERWPNLRLTIKRLIPTFRIVSWTIVIYQVVVVILAPPIETILAFTASAGIAVGFAAQDILKNVFGGVMILLDRPFQVGDKIQAGGHYGEVVQIGLRTVRIVTPDDNLVSIPNGEVMSQSVSNANAGEPNCQVVAEFFLPVTIDIERTKRIAYLAAATSRYVFLNKPIAVILKNEINQGRSLLKMRLKAYVLDIRYEFPFMSEMSETVIRELLQQGVVKPEELQGIIHQTN